MTIEHRMQEYYAARAPEYERVYQKPERQTDLRLLEGWLPALFAGKRVLEVAAGTGYWTQFVAPVAAAITVTDGSAETLALAQARIAPLPQARFLVADAYALPPTLGRFDAALAGFWFSHVPLARRRAFLVGLHARLEPGATVVLLDNRYVPGSNQPISECDAEGNSYQTRRLDDGSVHRVLKNFPGETELCAVIQGIGDNPHYRAYEYFWAFHYTTRAAEPAV